MIKLHKYEKYDKEIKKLEKLEKFNKKNPINYKSMLAVDVYNTIMNSKTHINYFKLIISNIFFKKKINLKNIHIKNKINLLYKHTDSKRDDCLFIEKAFVNSIIDKYNYIEIEFENKKFDFHFTKNTFMLIRLLLQLINIKLNYPLYMSLNILKIIKYDSYYREILKKYHIEKTVTFCDIHGDDNFITQVSNELGIGTYTLQHGMFNYECKKFDDMNFLHCEASIAKNVLVWGEFTKHEYMKCGKNSNNLHLVGNPKLSKFKRCDRNSYLNNTCFTVIFDHQMYIQSNINMIMLANELANTYNINYKIKMHPGNDIKDYADYIGKRCIEVYKDSMGYEKVMDNTKFVIVHNSSMYYEMIYLSMPTFRYKDKEFCDIDNFDFDKFENLEEIIEKIAYIKANTLDYFNMIEKQSKYFFYHGDFKVAVLDALSNG